MEKALRIRVSGRVQGVGYRYFAQRQADEQGIKGYVKNLPDGRVEVLAQGEESDVHVFIGILRAGPRFGYVTDVDIDPVEPEPGYTSFKIEY